MFMILILPLGDIYCIVHFKKMKKEIIGQLERT